MPALKVEIVKVEALGEAEWALWRVMQIANPALVGPCFRPVRHRMCARSAIGGIGGGHRRYQPQYRGLGRHPHRSLTPHRTEGMQGPGAWNPQAVFMSAVGASSDVIRQPPTQFRRLTKTESTVISPHSCWTGCAAHRFSGCRRGSQERPETLFFADDQDFNGLRGSLRGPIVFAGVRTLKTLAV